MGYDGHRVFAYRKCPSLLKHRQKVGGGEVLRVKHTVKSFEGKLTPAMQKIGQMRLSEPGLTRQKRHAERAALYSAQKFQAKPFVHLGEIHR
jgi:hypothetical protein